LFGVLQAAEEFAIPDIRIVFPDFHVVELAAEGVAIIARPVADVHTKAANRADAGAQGAVDADELTVYIQANGGNAVVEIS
jgi:hypothetical protein